MHMRLWVLAERFHAGHMTTARGSEIHAWQQIAALHAVRLGAEVLSSFQWKVIWVSMERECVVFRLFYPD